MPLVAGGLQVNNTCSSAFCEDRRPLLISPVEIDEVEEEKLIAKVPNDDIDDAMLVEAQRKAGPKPPTP